MMQDWLGSWSADTLKGWRDRVGLTQAEAAEQLGISLRAYTDRERGVSAVTRECALACLTLEREANDRKTKPKPYVAFYEPPQGETVPLPGIIAGMRRFFPMIEGRVYAFEFEGKTQAAFDALKAELETGAGLVVMEAAATQYRGPGSPLIGAAMRLSRAWRSGRSIHDKL